MKPESKGPWVALYTKTLYSKTFNLLTCVERSVFLQSLFMASRMEYDCLYNGHYYHLLPGQLVVSQRDLAEKCGRDCSRQIVRDTISKLVACGTITHSRAKSGTQSPSLITFINWDVYQRPLTHTTQSRTHSSTQLQPTDGIQPLINGGENASLQGSYKVDTQYNTQTRIEDTPIVPKLGKRKKAELTPEESEVLTYLNLKADNSFTASGEIGKRLAEGHTVEECKTIIDKKVAEWGKTEFAKNLNPTTLFRLCHFDTYLHQKDAVPMKKFSVSEIGKSNMGEEWG